MRPVRRVRALVLTRRLAVIRIPTLRFIVIRIGARSWIHRVTIIVAVTIDRIRIDVDTVGSPYWWFVVRNSHAA